MTPHWKLSGPGDSVSHFLRTLDLRPQIWNFASYCPHFLSFKKMVHPHISKAWALWLFGVEPVLNSLEHCPSSLRKMRLVLPRTDLPFSFPLKDVSFSAWKPNMGLG